MPNQKPVVVNFNQVGKDDISLVGGKGANLGEMIQNDFPIPDGFIVTSAAYFEIIELNSLKPKIKALIEQIDNHDINSLTRISQAIKKLIFSAYIPDSIAKEIINHYLKLGSGSNQTLVAVRSSATAEDLPDASFAGQQETFLNIRGEANLIQAIRGCWASLFEPRAMFYREEKGFNHFKVGIAVPVQKMIQSEVSGIMFTINPLTNDKNQVVIESIWGLGEKIVQGAYTPDHYLIEKISWKLLQKQVAPQTKEYVWKHNRNLEVKVPANRVARPKLTDKQITFLAQLGHRIQQHYFYPQDIEWAMAKDKIYIVQSRPVTTITAQVNESTATSIPSGLKLILKGEGASPGIRTAYTRILKSSSEINQLKSGEILVTSMTTPDFVPAMKKAAAIITDKGGQTSHAAIVSRELGIPCVVGTGTATKILKSQIVITVNGQTGEIYKGGKLSGSKTLKTKLKPIPAKDLQADVIPTATKLYVNLGEPDLASQIAQKNVDGIGLLRAEFMIAQIGVHPKKMIQSRKGAKFTQQLTEGLKKFCHAFYPRPVVYRATDFKTNEYANLIGGKEFEPKEANPMIGYRGAYRYIVDQQVFNLELEAIKKTRNQFGYKNLWLMLPFVRTVKELISVKKIISDHGLTRSPSFKLWIMVEIPSNVILLEDFIQVGIDGISIGSNDLTMLTLGVDRDNNEVAPEYDEMNPAVLKLIETAIKTASKYKISSSICGQAPSIYPDLTEKLISWGITSISVTPDAIDVTKNLIYQAEKKLLHA